MYRNEATLPDIASRDWTSIASDLNAQGCARVPKLVGRDVCESLIGMYGDDARFRSTIIMARHNFGRGEYRYFNAPLPPLIQQLRTTLYSPLAAIANDWYARMKSEVRFPAEHQAFIERCQAAGQMRPTPLLLKYGAGDYNCLHQDLYGEHVFPIQVAVLLSRPNDEFEGGEFVLTEQRPRMQSRVEVVTLQQGDAVVFAVHERPVTGTRGVYRVNMRHGVSRIRAGQRYTLGIIFHDAT